MGDNIRKRHPNEPGQHQYQAGHLGMKEESQTQHWTFGIEKGMKERENGERNKGRKQKRAAGRKETEKLVGGSPGYFLYTKVLTEVLTRDEMGGNKTSTISQLCGSQIHSIQIPRERHTFFEIGENIKQNE